MTDVTEIEDLLAALDEDSSKVLQHSGLPPQHVELIHMPQSSLPYDNVQTNNPNMLGHNTVQQSQVQGGLSGHLQLQAQPMHHGFPNQGRIPDKTSQAGFQSGSSLGSLFLSSVDELLSSEKTTPADFTPPTTTPPQTKPQRSKPKKPVQRKVEKSNQYGGNDSTQVMGQSSSYKQAVNLQQYGNTNQNNFQGSNRPPSNSAMSTDLRAVPSPETFSRNIYRQPPSQRPHSNASCDSSVYNINSIPQPSPSGSVDSNFNPRTPHSNNPLTPQSVPQPPTPQSHSSQGNHPATPINQQQQQQQSQMMHDPSNFGLGVNIATPPPPLPVVPDDQSHLQYLNTTMMSQQDMSHNPMQLLDDLPTPLKTQFGLDDTHLISNNNHPPTNNQSQQSNWYPQYSNNTGAPATNHSMVSNPTSNTAQESGVFHGNQQQDYTYQNFYLQNNQSQLSEGLTQSQSQLLDSISEWGKSKPKASATVSSNIDLSDFESSIVQSGPGVFGSTQSFAANTSSNNSRLNNVMSMMNTGVKQHFTDVYEAISPAVNHPNVAGAHDQEARLNNTSNTFSKQSVPYTSTQTSNTKLPNTSVHSVHKDQEKAKIGPMARRRSASVERKSAPSTATSQAASQKDKEPTQDYFDFDDEPTIKLPQHSSGVTITQPKKPVPAQEPPRNPPIMKLHRQDYADKSVYDSVQELVALREKARSLNEAFLSQSRNKTSPQKTNWNRVANVSASEPTPAVSTHTKTTKDRPKSTAKNLVTSHPAAVTSEISSKAVSATRQKDHQHKASAPTSKSEQQAPVFMAGLLQNTPTTSKQLNQSAISQPQVQSQHVFQPISSSMNSLVSQQAQQITMSHTMQHQPQHHTFQRDVPTNSHFASLESKQTSQGKKDPSQQQHHTFQQNAASAIPTLPTPNSSSALQKKTTSASSSLSYSVPAKTATTIAQKEKDPFSSFNLPFETTSQSMFSLGSSDINRPTNQAASEVKDIFSTFSNPSDFHYFPKSDSTPLSFNSNKDFAPHKAGTLASQSQLTTASTTTATKSNFSGDDFVTFLNAPSKSYQQQSKVTPQTTSNNTQSSNVFTTFSESKGHGSYTNVLPDYLLSNQQKVQQKAKESEEAQPRRLSKELSNFEMFLNDSFDSMKKSKAKQTFKQDQMQQERAKKTQPPQVPFTVPPSVDDYLQRSVKTSSVSSSHNLFDPYTSSSKCPSHPASIHDSRASEDVFFDSDRHDTGLMSRENVFSHASTTHNKSNRKQSKDKQDLVHGKPQVPTDSHKSVFLNPSSSTSASIASSQSSFSFTDALKSSQQSENLTKSMPSKSSQLPATGSVAFNRYSSIYTEPKTMENIPKATTASNTIHYTATTVTTTAKSGSRPSSVSSVNASSYKSAKDKKGDSPTFLPTVPHSLSGSQLAEKMPQYSVEPRDLSRTKSQEQRAFEAFASLSKQAYASNMYPSLPSHMIPDTNLVANPLEFLRLRRETMGNMSALTQQGQAEVLGLNLSTSSGYPSSLPPPYQHPHVTATQQTTSSFTLGSPVVTQAAGVLDPLWYMNKPSSTQHHLLKEQHTATAPSSVVSVQSKAAVSTSEMSSTLSVTSSTTSVKAAENLKQSGNQKSLPSASTAVSKPKSSVTQSLPTTTVTPSLTSNLTSDGKQPPDASSSLSTLKDRTYHCPKKKHILEKYSFQQHQKQGPALLTPKCTPGATTVTNSNQTVLASNSVLDFSNQSKAGNATPAKPTAGVSVTPSVSGTTKQATGGQATKTKKQLQANKAAEKEEQSGGIFSVFDSLLQEVLETAEIKKQEKTTVAPAVQAPIVTKPVDTVVPILTTSSTAASQSTISKSSATKSAPLSKTSRSPATFPFKRRVQNRPSTTQPLTNTTPVPTTTTPVPTTTASSKPPKVAELVETSTTAAPRTSVSVVDSTPVTTFAPALAKTPGLKLRITAFRSAAGDVIHHSSMVGSPLENTFDSDCSSKKRKHKKKKKKRKRKRKSSSSELDDNTPSESSVNLVIPPTIPKLPTFNSSDEQDADYVPKQEVRSNDSDPGVSIAPAVEKPKKKISTKILQPPSKRKRNSSAGSDIEPVKKRGRPPTKNKAPTMRYKPKSAPLSQTTTTSENTPPSGVNSMSFNRAPGNPPKYLNATGSTNPSGSAVSKSVPTIQLVPRTTTTSKSSSTASSSSVPLISPIQSAARVLSVKLSVAQTKAVQAQVVTKTTLGGLRYILQSSTSGSTTVSGAHRVIIPKIGSPPFSVGKATVFTVSSSGTRVSIAAPPATPTSPSTSPTLVSPTRPIVVKRFPISLLPKVTVASSSSVSTQSSLTSPVAKKSWASTALKNLLSQGIAISVPASSLSTVSSKTAGQTVTSSTVQKTRAHFPNVSTPILTEAKTSQQNQKGESLFQTAFSKLISSPNPLPKYMPPPLPQHLASTGPLGDTHRCFECGDTFLMPFSLANHYERRSIFVKVRCVQCNQMLVFFNKCEILRHAREHSDRGDVMQFNGANLTPIPLSLCKPRTKEFFLQAAQEKKANEEKKTSGSFVCTECQFMCEERSSLEDHLQRRNSEWRSCDICRLHLHNNCSFTAHMRMHRHVAPHTCPECGQTFDGTAMDFNLHLRMQCFHLSRISCYKCKLCNVTFTTDDQLRNHLRLNHVQLFYKCRECPMAFKTTQNIANHQRTAHNLTPEPTNTLKTIYKCPLCDTVFTDSSHSQQLFVLHKHFDTHINTTRITAYMCYMCSQIFEQKSLLRDHLHKEHDVSSQEGAVAHMSRDKDDEGGAVVSSKTGEKRRMTDGKKLKSAKRSKTDIVKPGSEKPSSDVNGTDKNTTRIEDSDDSMAPVGGEKKKVPIRIKFKGKSPHAGIKPPSHPNGTGTVLKDDGKRKYPCMECDKVFLSSHSRSSHVRSIHRGIRALYCCPHCPAGSVKFAKRISLVKHLKRSHSINVPTKEDVKIVRIHAPQSPVKTSPSPQKPSALHQLKDKSLQPTVSAGRPLVEERTFPRKKITTRNPIQARARRLAAEAASLRHQASKRLDSLESDESYGEVDEKTIEESWNVPDEMDAEVSDNEAEIDVTSLRLPSVYTCVKCDFQHKDRITFQEHIVEHSSRSLESDSAGSTSALTMVQCTECGLCFASTASLDKHMYIKHKIKQRKLLERYDNQLRVSRDMSGHASLASGGKDQSEGSTEAGASSLPKLHRCKVCFRKFDSDNEVRTHMRTHGLAFVKSKAS